MHTLLHSQGHVSICKRVYIRTLVPVPVHTCTGRPTYCTHLYWCQCECSLRPTDRLTDNLRSVRSGGSRLGPGHPLVQVQAPKSCPAPPTIFMVITVHKLLNTGQLDTVVLLVVASQMMRGQAPQVFFPRTAAVSLPRYVACFLVSGHH